MSNIAVIDDSRADLEVIESVLTGAGHRVVAFQDVAEIERLLADLQPDLVLLDVVMPQRNGYEILRQVRKHDATRGLKVALVSSKSEPADIAWGKRQGADGFIPKPFTGPQLLAEVDRLLTWSAA